MELQDIVQLQNHLVSNFYPPIPLAYNCAVEAIEAVNAGDVEKEVKTPSGNMMCAGEIIEELHLEFFINGDLFWDGEGA